MTGIGIDKTCLAPQRCLTVDLGDVPQAGSLCLNLSLDWARSARLIPLWEAPVLVHTGSLTGPVVGKAFLELPSQLAATFPPIP